MNYIELINNFWSMNEVHSFHSNEISLYFYLLKVNNLCSWKESFNHNNYKVMASLNISSFKTLSNARNRLKQAGLIDFETKNGSPDTKYSLLTLVKNTKVKDKVSAEVTDEVVPRSGMSKDKLNKTKVINKLLFVSITNLNESIQSFQGNKSYFFLAYRFWELWKKENPNHKHLEKAEAYDWVDTIRLIVETDKQTTKRLVGVLEYFRKCASKDARFRDFWYKTIKSIKALRNVDKNGVKYIDSIAEDLNDAMDKHEDFNRLVMSNIKKLQDYESNKSPA
ncbi:hypothetical protein CMU26_01175 [Elizabethkingia anophelis]|nr:hypothetical protein [Elizabethkingia anophelis]